MGNTKEIINNHIKSETNKCNRCGSEGHYADKCNY